MVSNPYIMPFRIVITTERVQELGMCGREFLFTNLGIAMVTSEVVRLPWLEKYCNRITQYNLLLATMATNSSPSHPINPSPQRAPHSMIKIFRF